jgi:hypothetical protein
MAIILKASRVNLFVSSVLFVFWYHPPNVLGTPRMYNRVIPDVEPASPKTCSSWFNILVIFTTLCAFVGPNFITTHLALLSVCMS